MANKVIAFDDVQSKKFLGNTVEKLAKGRLTLEELEITSRLIIDAPNHLKIEDLTVYVSTKDKVVVELEVSGKLPSLDLDISRNQTFILEYFNDESRYKWKDIKEKCFDEEIPVVLMEYHVFFENPHEEDGVEYLSDTYDVSIKEEELDKKLNMMDSKARLEMSVRLKRNKKQNAQNDRIVTVISEEILTDIALTRDLFYENGSCQQKLFGDVFRGISYYLEQEKQVKGGIASDVARKIGREAVKKLESKAKVNSSTLGQAQYITSAMFSWNQDRTMELDGKHQVVKCLRECSRNLFFPDIFELSNADIFEFVERHQDKIKEMIAEERRGY